MNISTGRIRTIHMQSKLYIIGNGFDLAHDLPTKFNPDFKKIAEKHEHENFWDIYQTNIDDIWSDFENSLAHPDFNSLEDIFIGYEPDYSSDREGDRNRIIYQVESNGNLSEALYEFANNAEKSLSNKQQNPSIEEILDSQGLYITFNYTHTLEYLYGIPPENVLHIHGEVGNEDLKLGYPKGEFEPEKYRQNIFEDSHRSNYIDISIEDYIDRIDDYYERTAYEELFSKCKSFYKEIHIDKVEKFLDEKQCDIKEIIVYGHSCAIDFDYFNYINTKYPDANWLFYKRDKKQETNIKSVIAKYKIKHTKIIELK